MLGPDDKTDISQGSCFPLRLHQCGAWSRWKRRKVCHSGTLTISGRSTVSEYGDGDDDVVMLSLMMFSVLRVRKAKVAMCYGDEDNDAVVLRTRLL